MMRQALQIQPIPQTADFPNLVVYRCIPRLALVNHLLKNVYGPSPTVGVNPLITRKQAIGAKL